MASTEKPKLTPEQQRHLDKVARYAEKDEKELLAYIYVQQGLANAILERTRKNTSTLVTIVAVLIVLEVLVAFVRLL